MTRRALLPVSALLIGAAASVITLWAARPALAGAPAAWSGDDLARVTCWAFAAVATAWLSGTALVFSIALVRSGLGGARRAVHWAPPFARHTLRAALAGSLAVAPPVPPVTVHVGTDGRLAPGPQPTSPRAAPTTTVPREAPRRSPPHAQPSSTRRHRVQVDDNLWTIARAELARRSGRDPDDREILPYWLRVIALNRATLRSGDPNVIHPGEVVALPNP